MPIESRMQETVTTYHNAAKRYEEKMMEMDLYHDTYDQFCSLIARRGAHIFEIATGPGNVTRYMGVKRPDFRISGIDLAPNMIDLARKNYPQGDFEVMDCRSIGCIHRTFDGVMCGFCAPYLSKAELKALIEDVANLLEPSGVFYLSTMEDDNEKSGFETTSFSDGERVYVYYHQADYLMGCLTEAGFEVLTVERKAYPEPDGSFLTDLIIIARKMGTV